MEIYVYEVDWDVFTSTFPKPGEWAEFSDHQNDYDALAFNIEAASVYVKLRGKCDALCIKALDLLWSAVCINGVSKKLDHSSVYKPTVKFNKDDFQVGCDGPLIPCSSPEQISMILDAFAAIPKGTLEEAIKSNWKASKAEMFENAKEYIAYIKNWIKVLKALKKAKTGLAIDIGA